MTITRRGPNPCMLCGETAEFTVADPTGDIAQAIWDWEHGKGYVQDIPDLTPGQREVLVSGAHEECFDAAFGEDDDD